MQRTVTIILAAVLSVICTASFAQTASNGETTLPEAVAIKYNNDITTDLGVGLWGIPIPVDFDSDGVNDLLVSCPDRPYKGIYYFRNIGTNTKPLFEKAQKVYAKGPNNIRVSGMPGKQQVLANGVLYEDFLRG